MNPRWELFLAVHGPKAKAWQYVVWIGRKWAEWREEHGVHADATIAEAQHVEFTDWLRQEFKDELGCEHGIPDDVLDRYLGDYVCPICRAESLYQDSLEVEVA